MTCALVILQCRTALLGLLAFIVCVEFVFGAENKCNNRLEHCQQHLLTISE